MDEPEGIQWTKVLAFIVPGLLLLGIAAFFFLRPSGQVRSGVSSEEAKEISRSSRVIKNDTARGKEPSTTIDPKAPDTQPATVATPNGATPLPDGTAMTAADGSQIPAPPRAFDPKTLAPLKPVTPPKRKGNGPLAGVAAPSLPPGSETQEVSSALPLAMSAPPPPAPVVPPAKTVVAPVPTPAPAPAATTAPIQSVEAARESAAHIGGVFAPPLLVHTVQPIYPPAAVQRKAQGTVRFQAVISKDGSIKNIQLLSGDPLLNVAARQAVAQWKYRPATLNGDAIEVVQSIVVNFNLSNK
jgi:protein TonB